MVSRGFRDGQTYPIFGRIFEACERDLIARLPTLYPNEADRNVAQEVLLALWRSRLVTALGSFMERTRPSASDRPIAEMLASLCADVDKLIKENRFLFDIDRRGKPLYDCIVACRKSVGAAIVKQLETERRVAEIHKHKKKHRVPDPTGPKCRRLRPAARSARQGKPVHHNGADAA
jgi:hypothetical protein